MLLYHIILILLMIIWGLSVVITKFILEYNDPFFVAFVRFFIAFLLFLLYNLLFKKNSLKNLFKIPFNIHLKIIFLSLLGVTLYFAFENFSLLYASSNLVSLITAIIPVISAIVGYMFLKEKLKTNEWLSILITFIGIVIVLNPYSIIENFHLQLKGAILILLAAFVWSFYSILGKDIFLKYDNSLITMLIMLWGSIAFIPFMIINKVTFNIDKNFILSILFLAVFGSALGYLGWNIAVRKLKVAIASNYLILMPIFTYISSYYILKEKLTLLFLIGSIISLIGLLFMFNFNYLKAFKLIQRSKLNSIQKYL